MSESEILFERRGRWGVVTLNRPKALNALSLSMIRAFTHQLRMWATDGRIAGVLVTGAGGKAFCAGGDVASLYHDEMARRRGEGDGAACRDFFREEYRLDRLTARFPKPYVCLIDGIVMGGGVGISVHGAHRVVGERVMFAMPETGIGLFPDVGASHVLSRLPGRLGAYLGLTGARLGAADLIHAGIATAHVPGARFGELADALTEHDGADVAGIIDAFATDPGEAPLASVSAAIARHFADDTVEGILASLASDEGDWARETLAILSRMSPTAMKLTLEAHRRGAGLDLDGCLVMEYRLSQACVAGHDFHEGVRAVLIDKDKTPKWSPETPEAVTPVMVEGHFVTPPWGDLTFDG